MSKYIRERKILVKVTHKEEEEEEHEIK